MNIIDRVTYRIFPYLIIGYYLGTILVKGLLRDVWFGSLYLLAYILFAKEWKRLLPVVMKDLWLISLIVLVGFSYAWSVAPPVTFAVFRSLIVSYVLACLVATHYKPEQIVGFLGKTLSYAGILSLIYILFLPQVAVKGGFNGAWRGIFLHQSILASTMAIAIISLFNFLLLNREKNKSKISVFLTVSLIFICLILLLFCGAKTAVVGLFASFSIVPFFFIKRIRGEKPRFFSFLALAYIFILGIPFVYLVKDFVIVDLLGKSTNLTGRDVTWTYLMSKASERPFLGYGTGAFFQNKQLAADFAAQVDRTLPSVYNAHSAYIDCLVGLGYIGISLMFLFIASLVYKNIVLAVKYKNPIALWNLQLLLFLGVAGYSDTFIGFLNPKGIGCFCICMISAISTLQLASTVKSRQQANDGFPARKNPLYVR